MGVGRTMRREFSLSSLRVVSLSSRLPQSVFANGHPKHVQREGFPATTQNRNETDCEQERQRSSSRRNRHRRRHRLASIQPPTLSAMERPSLHPQLSFDLRQAYALLVSKTNPPDSDEEDENNDALKTYEAERTAKYVALVSAAEAKAAEAEARRKKEQDAMAKKASSRKEEPSRYSLRRRREAQDAALKPAPNPKTQKHPATISGRQQQSQSKVAEILGPAIEPLPPVHATIIERNLRGKQKEAEALKQIQASMGARPLTSAAASIDYNVTAASSKSTSRSNSDYQAIHQAGSTGMTSAAMTPNMDGRMSRMRRPSDESYRDKEDTEAWIRELARRRADEYISSGRASRNGKRTSRFSRKAGASDDDRPGSRAGSIASSITGGFSNYFRHGGSTDSLHSTRTGRSGLSSSLGLLEYQHRISFR